MNSSHLVTPMNTHHHHNNRLHTNSYTKLPATNNDHNMSKTSSGGNSSSSSNNNINNSIDQLASLSSIITKTNTTNVGAGLTNTQTMAPTTTTATQNKFAPARRLAARQTLRLAIPKQQGDSQQHSALTSTSTTTNSNHHSTSFTQFRHSSPSQLPPAPILRRTPFNTTTNITSPASSTVSSLHSHIPKSASPLESHNLPNVLQYNSGSSCTATPSSGGSGKFLSVRNPSITLNSSDVNNDFFGFAKDLSSPNVREHSPIFAEITSSISPSVSSGSPTNHLNRLFNLSPSSLRNYGNVSKEFDFLFIRTPEETGIN